MSSTEVLPQAALAETEDDVSSGESGLDSRTSASSTGISSPGTGSLAWKLETMAEPGSRIDIALAEFYSENVVAKIWRTATRLLEEDTTLSNYPEFIPSSGPGKGIYQLKPARFWTCGFFPGCLYALLERSTKFPKYFPLSSRPDLEIGGVHDQLLELCRSWSNPLHEMAERTDTHDLGFIINPLRADWELTGNTESLKFVIKAAYSLASRYDERLGAIRSWDKAVSKRYEYYDGEENFLVIIDSMCNMDLLFYVGYQTKDQRLIDIATSHAHFALRNLVREDYSTFHVVNYDPRSKVMKERFTHQGYQDWSCWSRGQAWAILGFTQTYIWTKDSTFLEAAMNLSEHFLNRLSASIHKHPFVPAWDFDAPQPENAPPLRDTSAGMIAANGLILLHQILHNNSPYLAAVLQIARDTLDLSLSPYVAKFSVSDAGELGVENGEWDGILMHSTANNNEHAMVRYSDHGLVYAEYYFMELGNKMLRMGLV